MAKNELVIELNDAQLERIRRIAEPFGVAAEDYLRTLVRDVVGPSADDESATEVAVRARTLAVPIRHDQAILLADFLRRLELPVLPSAVERSARIDEHQVEALAHLRELLEGELPGDYGEYVELARRCAEKGRNWLDAKDIACPGCERTLGWQLRSPFHDSLAALCDSCPRQVEISHYDPVYDEIQTDLVMDDDLADEDYSPELHRRIEGRLIPCPCGGIFRFEARRRCPHCAEPIPPRIGDVGEYGWREVYPAGDDGPGIEKPVLTEDVWRS